MSDLQGRRIPGEEDSGRRRPLLWIILGLILLLLLAILIPFACQSMNGDPGQQGEGSGAQGGSEGSDRNGGKETENAKPDEAQAGGAQNGGGQPDGGQGNGGQGDGGQGDGGQGVSEEPQDVATARLSARDQGGDGETVTVPAATLEGTKGWLAVRANDGGEPGEVLGYSPLQAGTNNDVEVELDRPVDSSQRLYSTVHEESPADGKFTFPTDDPTATRGGQAAVEPIYYTVDDGASGRANDGIRDDELPESGGVPAGALLAAGALLLASSVAGFTLALRRGNEFRR